MLTMKGHRQVIEAQLAERATRAGSPVAGLYQRSSVGRNASDEWLGHAPALLIPAALLLAWAVIIVSGVSALT